VFLPFTANPRISDGFCKLSEPVGNDQRQLSDKIMSVRKVNPEIKGRTSSIKDYT
jgi:hypothetical protein